MPNAAPNLGYGQRAEVSIDKVNQWMRGQPWYQQTLASFGQSPDNVHLNDSQKQAVVRAAQANGVVVDEGNNGQEIDDSGNFRAKGHKLRNTLIVAGIAAATLATMGAAGVFSAAAAPGAVGGAAGGAAGGSSAAGAAAALAADPWYGAAAANLASGSALGSAAFGGAAGGAAATSMAGTDAATSGADAGAWGGDGSFLGDSTVTGAGSGDAAAGGSSVFSRMVSKYGAGAVSQGVEEYLQQQRNEDALAERRRETDQRTALDESALDPFRGYMAQGRDMSRLDLMGHDYTPTPLQLDSKYGAGVDMPQGPSYAPSALTRQVLQGAQRGVAAGNTVPTMTNPSNYGNIPVARTDPTAMASGSPLSRPLGPALPRRRRWPGQTDDENSPWLRPSV